MGKGLHAAGPLTVCKSALCTTLPDGIVYKPVLSP